MISLLLAAIFFVGIHVLVSGTSLRATIVAKTGEVVYQTAFSVVSLLGLIWLGWAYAAVEPAELWDPAAWLRPVTHLLTLLSFLFVAIGMATPSPTAVGGEAALTQGVTATGIQRITRHPFLWGVALWAVAHLLVSADLASLIFFGSLLLLALVGPPSIDAKRERIFGEQWTRFAESTSSVPFLAISQGRNQLSLAEIGWWRVALALVLYAVFLGAHAWLFGVSPFGA
jgi:uncharacterized membrane protein